MPNDPELDSQSPEVKPEADERVAEELQLADVALENVVKPYTGEDSASLKDISEANPRVPLPVETREDVTHGKEADEAGDIAVQQATTLANSEQVKTPEEAGWPKAISDKDFDKIQDRYNGQGVVPDMFRKHFDLAEKVDSSSREVKTQEHEMEGYGRIRKWLALKDENYIKAKEEVDKNQAAYNEQAEEALTFREQAREEALEYANAYESYAQAYDLLCSEFGIQEPRPEHGGMEKFMTKFDKYWWPTDRHRSAKPSSRTNGEYDNSIAEAGIELALLDVIAPEVHHVKKQGSNGQYHYDEYGINRELRQDLELSEEEALELAKQKGYSHVLQFTTQEFLVGHFDSFDSRSYAEKMAWERNPIDEKISYLPISEQVFSIVNQIDQRALNVEASIQESLAIEPYNMDVIRRFGRQLEYKKIKLSTEVLTTEEAKKPKDDLPILEFDIRHPNGRRGLEHRRLVLRGSTKDAQQQALYTVQQVEMDTSSPMSLVGDPIIRLPDGSQVSWQEFTEPALQRQNQTSE